MNARGPEAGASLLSLSFHRLKRHPFPPESEAPRPSVFHRGRNVWRTETASRAAFLIDADAYFRAFVETITNARQSIYIVGWDTDSRTELPRPDSLRASGQGPTITLGELLAALVRRNPNLEIYVLSWDFAFIYLFERESLPGLKFATLADERLRFVLDQEHPFWASHHQKIVVVDDRVAFSGGLDITQRRWDTPEHLAHDQRRVDPGGHAYGPFHDVQICVEGNVARALGDIARERWKIATGGKESLSAVEHQPEDLAISPWPRTLAPDMTSIDVSLARTHPIGYGVSENGPIEDLFDPPGKMITEVERLFLDTIRSVRRFAYIENQYFTSPVIARAIAKRLEEPDGPEFVMVLPRDQTGWIEESTMGLLRSKALRIVERADRDGRFKCYFPVVPGLEAGYVKVHSKVMIVDDQFVRIGSANLNSRSMGLDTECDVAIEADARPELKLAIANLRRRLLGEHLDVEPAEFEARFLMNRSLVETVESFRGRPRTLVELRSAVPEWLEKVAPPRQWIDPSGPRGIRRWVSKKIHLHKRFVGATLIVSVVLGLLTAHALEAAGQLPSWLMVLSRPWDQLASGWSWLRSWDTGKIASNLELVRGQPWAFPAVLASFVLGSLIFVPIMAMIVAISLVFPRWEAFTLALGGSLLASLATYGVGRYWAWSKSRFLSQSWVKKVSEKLRKGGPLSVAAVRLAPVAPFWVVGLVAGGLKIPIQNYLLGSLIGLFPGVLVLTVLSSQASAFVTRESASWVLSAAVVLLISYVLGTKMRRSWRKRTEIERATQSRAMDSGFDPEAKAEE